MGALALAIVGLLATSAFALTGKVVDARGAPWMA